MPDSPVEPRPEAGDGHVRTDVGHAAVVAAGQAIANSEGAAASPDMGAGVATSGTQRPVRAGVFADAASASAAVDGLLAAGFTVEHISVVCSDPGVAARFSRYTHDAPAGATTAASAGAGAVVGGIAAGIAAVSVVLATGGLAILAVGSLFAGAGAVAGSFVGAMLSRGVEHEVANYYDQALAAGDILVAAEVAPGDDMALLDRAGEVLRAAGARPLSLPQG